METQQIFLTSTASTTFRLALFSFFLFCLLFIPTTTAQDNPSLVELSVDDHSKSVLLGDSVTFGWGVSESDSYPRILEKILHQEGYDIEVINDS